ncbi:thioredoxin reductase [Bacteroidota bacterium]|nr:thioredoxin reductase [Bacteroidota bacterium]
MKKIIPKHPFVIRWTHWVNFPVLAVMIWSGLLIYWANDIYKISLGDFLVFKFFPDPVYKSLNVEHRLSEGMAYHFTFMWLFMLNGLFYILYTIFSGEWRYLLPNKKSFKEAWQVLLHDLFISRKPLPEKKFNGAQQIAYTAIIIMGIFSVLSGIAIYKPVQWQTVTFLLGGYESARIIHFILTIGYVLFFLVHIMQVIRAGWNNFRAMVTGWEVVGSLKQLAVESPQESKPFQKEKITESKTEIEKITPENIADENSTEQ